MSILEELTKDFQYEENVVNPEIRKLISGNFRGLLVNKNGFCYCGSNTKTMKLLTKRGYYGSTTEDKTWIKPWRLTALVWYDQTPSLHLIDSEKDKDKYLNLLAFIKVLEKYPDEYELLMNGSKTNYYPLSRGMIFNVVTGCLGRSCNNYKRFCLNEYERINWYFFEEIGDKIEFDFYKFKNELSEELKINLKSETSKVIVYEEEDPEEELEVCLSNPELGSAPSLRPKVKEVQTQSDNNSSKENKVNEYEEEKVKEEPQEVQADTKVAASSPIDELQELFDRRAQLKKELAEIEEKIKASIFH